MVLQENLIDTDIKLLHTFHVPAKSEVSQQLVSQYTLLYIKMLLSINYFNNSYNGINRTLFRPKMVPKYGEGKK